MLAVCWCYQALHPKWRAPGDLQADAEPRDPPPRLRGGPAGLLAGAGGGPAEEGGLVLGAPLQQHRVQHSQLHRGHWGQTHPGLR